MKFASKEYFKVKNHFNFLEFYD